MSTEIHESPMMKCKEGDDFVFVQFKWEPAKNNAQSEKEGRPIYDRVLRAYITVPGSKNQVMAKEVERRFWVAEGEPEKAPRINEDMRMRFREQLAAFEAGSAEELTGTPLKELVSLDVAAIASLKDAGIYTIEALAGVADANLFMGVRKWREEAKAYLEKADGDTSSLVAENERMKDEIADLKRQVEELAKPKGRKTKEAA